eukprot:scaffold17957_cov31-Phaeocystis_antarctica.AAC.1
MRCENLPAVQRGVASPPENDAEGTPAQFRSEPGISSPSSTVTWPEVASSSDELARSLLLLKGGDKLAAALLLRAALAHLEAFSPDPVTDDATGATLPATTLPAINPLPPAGGARLASQSMPTAEPDETRSSFVSAAESNNTSAPSSAPAAATSRSAPPGPAPVAAAADHVAPPTAAPTPAAASTASGKRARTEAGDRGDGRGAPSDGGSAGRARLPRVGINPTTDEIDGL